MKKNKLFLALAAVSAFSANANDPFSNKFDNRIQNLNREFDELILNAQNLTNRIRENVPQAGEERNFQDNLEREQEPGQGQENNHFDTEEIEE
jgi:hypothetical protein